MAKNKVFAPFCKERLSMEMFSITSLENSPIILAFMKESIFWIGIVKAYFFKEAKNSIGLKTEILAFLNPFLSLVIINEQS